MEWLENFFRGPGNMTFGDVAMFLLICALFGAASYVIKTRGFRVFSWIMVVITGTMLLGTLAAEWLVG